MTAQQALRPRISVCIPAADAGAFLVTAVRSVLAQGRDDVEILVHDDGSHDGSLDALSDLASPAVAITRHRKRLGIARNRNTLIEAARGDFLAWLDADDFHLGGALATQCSMLERHGAGFVHGGFLPVDRAGGALKPWPAPFDIPALLSSADALQTLLLGNYVNTSTVMVRADVQRQAGWFRTSRNAPGEDWDMWLRIARVSAVAYISEPLAAYRQHPASAMSRARMRGSHLVSDWRIVDRALAAAPHAVTRETVAATRGALASRGIDDAWDLLTRHLRWRAARTLLVTARCRRLVLHRNWWAMMRSIVIADELGAYLAADALKRGLAHAQLDAATARPMPAEASADPDETARVRQLAATIRSVIPSGANVAAIAKWDPRPLGWAGVPRRCRQHLPDRRFLPHGYPADSTEAVAHLAQLQRHGVQYLVVPSTSFWWLDFYPGFAMHLEHESVEVHADADVRIWRLGGKLGDGRGSPGRRPASRQPQRSSGVPVHSAHRANHAGSRP